VGGEGDGSLLSPTSTTGRTVRLPVADIFSETVARKPFKNVASCWYCVHRCDSITISPSFTIERSTLARLFSCVCNDEFRGSEAASWR
jgi:hypothetical protein